MSNVNELRADGRCASADAFYTSADACCTGADWVCGSAVDYYISEGVRAGFFLLFSSNGENDPCVFYFFTDGKGGDLRARIKSKMAVTVLGRLLLSVFRQYCGKAVISCGFPHLARRACRVWSPAVWF